MAEIDLELLRTIRRIQIRTTHLAQGLLAGAYRSAYKGKGLEFEEVREYQPGDDMRSIDWNVTARLGHPYVKNFREERELTVILVVDLSASCLFGQKQHPKNRLISEIAALLAFSATGNNDKVGLLTFADSVKTFLAPKRGSKHVLRMIRELLVSPSVQRGTDLAQALAFLGRVQRRRAVCFIISDFLSGDFSQAIRLLANRHDVTAILVNDLYEAQFPTVNLAEVADLETGKNVLVDTADAEFQAAMPQAFEARKQALKKLLLQVNGGFISISTEESSLQALDKFFKMRGRRLR